VKLRKLLETIRVTTTKNGRHARRTPFGRILWWLSAAASMAASVFLVVNVAWSQSSGTKPQSIHQPPPYWAFAVDPPATATHKQDKPAHSTFQNVPGSQAKFTVAQTRDFFNPPDWHPDQHPAMPEVVAHGRRPDVFACAYCHLPNGEGRPENSSLAGLPASYIIQQMTDFKSGARKSSEPRHKPVAMMIAFETKASEKETQAAAEYFSRLKPKTWIRVVETETVPKTHVSGWMLVRSEPGGMEPIGQRIIETPENLEQTELRDDASGFIAYVPAGSIKKGKMLVLGGGAGKTVPCTTCHGPALKGLAKVPSLAGRSPSYVVRQLYDMQSGARAGAASQFMKPVVANLTVEDMVSIAAYTASIPP
jgi:cytochrome c553